MNYLSFNAIDDYVEGLAYSFSTESNEEHMVFDESKLAKEWYGSEIKKLGKCFGDAVKVFEGLEDAKLIGEKEMEYALLRTRNLLSDLCDRTHNIAFGSDAEPEDPIQILRREINRPLSRLVFKIT